MNQNTLKVKGIVHSEQSSNHAVLVSVVVSRFRVFSLIAFVLRAHIFTTSLSCSSRPLFSCVFNSHRTTAPLDGGAFNG